MLDSRPLRLAILASGGGTTMLNLADVIARGELNAQIVCCIVSNTHCRAIPRAQAIGIPTEIIARKNSPSVEDFSRQILAALHKHRADLVLMAGFLSLWQIPAEFTGRVLNIHPALLPKFGGQGMHGHHVHEAVLAAREKESGCTVHFADNSYDTGPIIIQRPVPVLADDTPDTLAKRVFAEECIAYPEAIRLVARRLPAKK